MLLTPSAKHHKWTVLYSSHIYMYKVGLGWDWGERGCYKYAVIVQIFCHSRNLQMSILYFFLPETVTNKKRRKK